MSLDADEAGLEVAGEEEEPGEDTAACSAPLVSEAKPAPPPQQRKGKKKPPPAIRINLANCRYNVLRNVQRKLGWKEVGDEDDWEVYWTDTSVGIERIVRLSKTQKINHFNGMLELCRKKSMARNLSKMLKLFPEHYDFMPRTFSLPLDMQELMNDVRARGKKQIYILKPDAGSQGKGIRLVQGGKEEAMAKAIREMDLPNAVAQHYLAKPLLVNGFKFDMRIYALVLSCDPLRLFIYKEGLTRICTEKYLRPKGDNLSLTYMHLTNYAVNKHNESFLAGNTAQAEAEAAASKWTLAQLASYLKKQGYEWQCIWERIQHLIVKSLISVQPIIRNNYRSILPPDNDGFSCFEILGFDIMLDSELKPWLLEVNHSPSFSVDSPLDLAIKEQLIMDTFNLARIDPKLIAKAKKAERKATAGRLLEPLHKRKPASAAPSSTPSSVPSNATPSSSTNGGAGPTAPSQSSQPSEEGTSTRDAAASAGTPNAGLPSKLKTPEEYEALKLEMLAKREKYEAKHMGAYERIYPSPNQELQELYEKLLKGAMELFQSSFQAKAKRALESLGEERRKKEECESDSVKAEKARARAHRDRLAQMAMERRAKKAEEKAEAEALAEMQVIPPDSGFPTPDTFTHATCFPASLAYPGAQLPLQPPSHYPGAAAGGWGLLGGNMGWAGYAAAVDEGPRRASALSLLNRLGSYGGGATGVLTHEPDDVYAVGMQLPAQGHSEAGNPACHSDYIADSYQMSAHPNSLQASIGQGVTTTSSSFRPPSCDDPGLRMPSSSPQQRQQELHYAEPTAESHAVLSSQPIRSLVRKSMENSSIAEANVPPLTFGPQFPPHQQHFNEPSRSLSRSSTFECDNGAASQGRTPPPITHGATTCSLQGLSLQPGSLSSSGGYHVVRRTLPPHVPPAPHHHSQPTKRPQSPAAAVATAVAAQGSTNVHARTASAAQAGSERPYVPSLKAGLSSWGNQERTLPASFLSPRSQGAAVRPSSSSLHTRPGSSMGDDTGRTITLSHSSQAGLHEGSKLAPSGLSSPPHPIYSSANPAMMSASPASLAGGIIGSPAKPSSASSQRSRRTLSAPHKDSSRHTEGVQATLQCQHQQALEHRLQQLQRQQQQQEEHLQHAPSLSTSTTEQPPLRADPSHSAPRMCSPPAPSKQHTASTAVVPSPTAARAEKPGAPGPTPGVQQQQQQRHHSPPHAASVQPDTPAAVAYPASVRDQGQDSACNGSPEPAPPSTSHLRSSVSLPVPTAAPTAGATRPEHPAGSLHSPAAASPNDLPPRPTYTDQFNSVTGPLQLNTTPPPAPSPFSSQPCPPSSASALPPHTQPTASQAQVLPRQHPSHLPSRPSSVPPRSSSASPLIPSTSLTKATLATTPHAVPPSIGTSHTPSPSQAPQHQEQGPSHTPLPLPLNPPIQHHHHHSPQSLPCDTTPPGGCTSTPPPHSLHEPTHPCRPSSDASAAVAQHQHRRQSAAAKPPPQGFGTGTISSSIQSSSSMLRRNSRGATLPTTSAIASAPVHMLYSLGGFHKEAHACTSPALASASSISMSRHNLQESTRTSKQLLPGRTARSASHRELMQPKFTASQEAQQGAGQSAFSAGAAACGGGLRGRRSSSVHACGGQAKGRQGSTNGSTDEIGGGAGGALLSVTGDSPLLSVMGYGKACESRGK